MQLMCIPARRARTRALGRSCGDSCAGTPTLALRRMTWTLWCGTTRATYRTMWSTSWTRTGTRLALVCARGWAAPGCTLIYNSRLSLSLAGSCAHAFCVFVLQGRTYKDLDLAHTCFGYQATQIAEALRLAALKCRC